MKVSEVKEIAEQWVSEHAAKIPGFAGAFYKGSIISLPDQEDFSSSSDVDLHIVIDGEKPEDAEEGKLVYRRVTLEVNYGPIKNYQRPEQLLANNFLAFHFRVPNIISDPLGHLTSLQKAVSRNFAKRQWVEKRCQSQFQFALGWVKKCLSVGSEDAYMLKPFFNLMASIISGVCVPVLADLRSPTARKSLVLCREILAKYGKLSCFEDVLAVLGCAELGKSDVEALLRDTTTAFNRAVQVIRTPFIADYDVCEAARPICIGGSQELISTGDHREAVLLVMIVFNRSILAIQNDAPDAEKLPFLLSYQKTLQVLGFGTDEDSFHRVAKWKETLNEIRNITDEILDMNPEIRD